MIVACGLSSISIDMAANLLDDLSSSPTALAVLLRSVNQAFCHSGLTFPARVGETLKPSIAVAPAALHWGLDDLRRK